MTDYRMIEQRLFEVLEPTAASGCGRIPENRTGRHPPIRGNGAIRVQLLAHRLRRTHLLYGAKRPLQLRDRQLHA